MKKLIACTVIILLVAALSVTPIFALPTADKPLDFIIYKATTRPVIDGVVSPGEWGEPIMYQESGVGLTFYPDDMVRTNEFGVKAYAYMLWDEAGVYVATVVEDPVHYNNNTGMGIWDGDAFEFDSNFNKADYTDRNRQCFGMNNDGEIYGGSYKNAEGVNWSSEDIQFTEYKVTRSGIYTTYELFVEWKNFCPDGAAFAKEGNVFRGNIQYHIANEGTAYLACQRYVEFDAATETMTFPNFILSSPAPVIIEVEEVPDIEIDIADVTTVTPTVPPVSPQTSDPISLFVFLGVAGLSVLVSKKRK